MRWLWTSAQETWSGLLWGRKGFCLPCCRVTQLDLHFEMKPDGAVQFTTAAGLFWNISYLKIFSKGKGCWEGFWFYLFVRLWIILFVLWGIKVLQLWEIAFCLTGIRKQLSSLSVCIRLVTSVCHFRECVSLSFQIVLALLLSGKTFLARLSNRNKGN